MLHVKALLGPEVERVAYMYVYKRERKNIGHVYIHNLAQCTLCVCVLILNFAKYFVCQIFLYFCLCYGDCNLHIYWNEYIFLVW